YYPSGIEDTDKKLPAVIWLHPLSNPQGYVAAYKRGTTPHVTLLRQTGMVVFCYDQIGNGGRVREVTRFYERYPHWSLMGKMVADARAAVDTVERLPFVDPKRIHMLGYAMGGMVALHAAALDERVAGVVSVAGFTPMRYDIAERGTGGVARWSHWLVLQPRLGAFVGRERRIPYDYDEVLGLIAPRPLLVVTPKKDRESTLADIEACLAEVKKVYALFGADNNLQRLAPDDYNRYSPELQEEVNKRLKQMATE
ncbi:alpha/beta fold hydrolase, partial [Candidatus Sumerlaeota bacterium]|nr:alpha/beta fold hydrolase [Candidatus Sumerlaeota bacterium]